MELFRAAVEAMGRAPEFQVGEWARVKGMLERGEVDALPLVGRTPEREAVFDFSFPYMTLSGAIVVRSGTTGIERMEDLRGRRVAVMRADNADEYLRRQERGIEIHATATFEEALRELAAGRHDAVVIQRLVALRLIRELNLESGLQVIPQPIEDFRQHFCFAVRKGDAATLALLNEGLALVIADGTHRRLYAKWFAAMELPSQRRILVGGSQDNPPYEFIDAQGHPNGFAVELSHAIARVTGLDLDVRLGPWSAMVRALETGKVDAIQGMFYSPARAARFDFTAPHHVQHYVAVARSGGAPPPETLEALAGRDLVVQAGDFILEELAARVPDARPRTVGTQEDVLREVAEGRADLGLVVRLSAMDLVKRNGWSHLALGRHPLAEAEYCIAVAKGQPALLAQFNEGLRVLRETGEYRRIQEKWLGAQDRPVPWRSVLRILAWVAGPLLLALLLALHFSWVLRRVVRRRTRELRASEEQLRALVEGAPDAIFVQTDHRFAYVNARACRLFGAWSPAVLLGTPVMDRFHPKVREAVRERIRLLNDAKEPVPPIEEIYLRLDGAEVPVEVSAVPFDYNGRNGALVFARDITERKGAEQAVRRSEDMMRMAGELAHLGAWRIDLAAGRVQWSDEVARIHDMAPGSSPTVDEGIAFFAPEHRRRITEAFAACAREGTPYDEELQIVTKQGRRVWVRTIGVPERDAAGRIAAIQGGFQDITKQRLAEEKLRQSEQMNRTLVSASPLPIVSLDAEYNVLSWNEAATRVFGWPAEEAVGHRLQIETEDGTGSVDELLGRVRRGETLEFVEAVGRGRDGSHRAVSLSASPIFGVGAEVLGIVAVLEDITERKKAEQHILHLNRVLRAIRDVNQLIVRERDPDALLRAGARILVDHRGYLSAAIVRTRDADGAVQGWAAAGAAAESPAFREMLDRGECPRCCAAAPADGSPDVIRDGDEVCGGGLPFTPGRGTVSICTRLVNQDAGFGFLIVTLPAELAPEAEEIGLIREIAGDLAYALADLRLESSRRESERERESLAGQLAQAQKMEAVGRLAGGVAHDFNNLIMGIMGYVDMCREQVGAGHPSRALLNEVMACARRSADLTRQLLAFARRQTIAPRMLDLNGAVTGLLKLLHRLLGEDIDLVWSPGADAGSILIDPSQMDQVLANLCVNARDAIRDSGKMTIETDRALVDEAYCASHVEAKPGDYAVLAVSDNGSGMTTEVMAHVFEPFFTTKAPGTGTGLGLATVYGIVRQNGGFVNVYSEPGRGTTFRIYLPRAGTGGAEPAPATEAATPPRGSETLLLVEDDRSIREVAGVYLSGLGYCVLRAANPAEALDLARRQAGDIALLVTDVIMPGMSGRELADRLTRERPAMKCLFMSGYTANAIAHHGVLDPGVDFLQKPVALLTLAVRVRAALDRAL